MARILFYSPHSAIWPHAFPEALVGEALKNGGDEIIYVTCGGAFATHCVSMRSMGIGPGDPVEMKANACETCHGHGALIRREFEFQGYTIASQLGAPEQEEADRLLAQLDRRNLLGFNVNGLELGRIALYEFLLDRKRSNLDFNDEEFKQYRDGLRNCLLSYLASRKIIDREKPDAVVTFASLYSVIAVNRHLANQKNIPFYCMTGGPNIAEKAQTLSISRDDSMAFLLRVIDCYSKYSGLTCNPSYLPKVTAHFRELFKAQSVFAYSAPMRGAGFDVRQYLGVKEGQKLLVAVMSSYDERFAAEAVKAVTSEHVSAFRDQIEWISKLIEFAERRPDLFVLVRVHPREFPNKRESAKSDHSEKLQKLFQTLPANMRINWPTDELSIYDLAQETDLFLNAWSSVGKEMNLLGIPVLLFSPTLPFYPSSFCYVETDQAAYFDTIDRALSEGWSFERIRRAFRWYVVEYGYSVLPIHEGYRRRSGVRPPFWRRAVNKFLKGVFPRWQEWLDCRLRARELSESGPLLREMVGSGAFMPMDLPARAPNSVVSEEEEARLVREEMRKIAACMFRGRAPGKESSLQRRFREAGLLPG